MTGGWVVAAQEIIQISSRHFLWLMNSSRWDTPQYELFNLSRLRRRRFLFLLYSPLNNAAKKKKKDKPSRASHREWIPTITVQPWNHKSWTDNGANPSSAAIIPQLTVVEQKAAL